MLIIFIFHSPQIHLFLLILMIKQHQWNFSASCLLLSGLARNRDFATEARSSNSYSHTTAASSSLKLEIKDLNHIRLTKCKARRRARLILEDEEEEDGNNEEIATLEMYTQSARDEVLIVNAVVDDEQVQVIVFKGFSSCLSYRTSADPTKSVLPARAVIKSIDRVKGPFDPSKVEYLEKDLSFETFKTRLLK